MGISLPALALYFEGGVFGAAEPLAIKKCLSSLGAGLQYESHRRPGLAQNRGCWCVKNRPTSRSICRTLRTRLARKNLLR